MSKRQLFIIIAILVVADIAAAFWYMAGHLNSDGKGIFGDDMEEEQVDSVAAERDEPDHFQLHEQHAYFVSRSPLVPDDGRTYLTCIKRYKGRIPTSVNGSSALNDLLSALNRKAFDHGIPSVQVCVNEFLQAPTFSMGRDEIDYKPLKAAPEIMTTYGYVQGVKIYPAYGSRSFLSIAVDKTCYNGTESTERMAFVNYDRVHHRVIDCADVLDTSRESAIVPLLTKAVREAYDSDLEVTKLPTELCPRRNGIYFIFPAGTLRSKESQVYLSYKKLNGLLTPAFSQLVKTNADFTTYQPISFK